MRRHGIVQIQVAVHSLDIFVKSDDSDEASTRWMFMSSYRGYAFRFVLEGDDFVPDDDIIPRI